MSRKEQKEQTRARITEAALEVVARDGLLAANTADIAQAAGVAHGTVFAHFPTRDDLLCAVIEEFGARVAYRMHILAENGTGVRQILQAHVQGLRENERLYVRLITEGRLIPEKARMSFVMIQSAISLHLGAAVERETRDGGMRPMPLHLFFNTWIGLVHYYLSNGDLFAPGEASVLAKHGDALIDHFCALVART